MIDAAVWNIFAGLLGVLALLGTAVLALQRFGIIKRGPTLTVADADETTRKLGDIEKSQADILARVVDIEARLKRDADDRRKNAEAIADNGKTAAELCGAVQQMSKQLSAINAHLIARGS